MADELFSDQAWIEYCRRKAARKHWPSWDEKDPYGNPIFPCDKIFEQTIPIEAPIAPRRKRLTSSK
jgi:hypothetical protein